MPAFMRPATRPRRAPWPSASKETHRLRGLLILFGLAAGAACQSSPPPPPAPVLSPLASAVPPRTTASAAPSPSRAPAAPSAVPSTVPSTVASTVASALPSPSAVALPTASPTVEPLVLDEHPFAVMIDNISEARPQSGLGAADVVYEAPAEAGIPRLMPIFLRAGGEADWIGPVRSARDYFVYLANEYRAPLVHIGASPQGFAALSETGLPDVDETRNGAGFTRDRRRLAPHNAFVSTESIRDELARRDEQTSASQAGLTFGAYTPGPETATQVTIAYPGPEHYTVRYEYDPGAHSYARTMDGLPHKDGVTGEQYAARAIVVEYVEVAAIPGDAALRVSVGLVGTGQGLLVADGTQVPLAWTKPSHRAPTTYQRADGVPFSVPPGQVWVQIVPIETAVSVVG